MKKYNFDEYCKKNRPVFSIQRAETDCTKPIRRKPRPEEEWKAFFVLAKNKWDIWLRDGIIQKTGKRKYLLKI